MRYAADTKTYKPTLSKEKLPIENPELQAVLDRPYHEDTSGNLEKTSKLAVKAWLLQWSVKQGSLLNKKGIDPYNLDPSSAFLLVQAIIIPRLGYDYDQMRVDAYNYYKGVFKIPQNKQIIVRPGFIHGGSANVGEKLTPQEVKTIMERSLQKNEIPVETLLSTKDQYVVCRHYARVYRALFEALKSIQKGTGLQNTYMPVVESRKLNHAWNVGVTVEPGKRLSLISLDSTNGDVKQKMNWGQFFRIGNSDIIPETNRSLYGQMYWKAPKSSIYAAAERVGVDIGSTRKYFGREGSPMKKGYDWIFFTDQQKRDIRYEYQKMELYRKQLLDYYTILDNHKPVFPGAQKQ